MTTSRGDVQSGDWGAHIATSLGVQHPETLIGIHLNFLPLAPHAKAPTDEERRQLQDQRRSSHEKSGYAWTQGTRPQTLAFARAGGLDHRENARLVG